MARVEIPVTIQKVITFEDFDEVAQTAFAPVQGDAPDNATVQVNVRGGSSATVYAAETGGATLSNPLSPNDQGRVDGWVDEGSYDIVIQGSTITTYTQPWEATRGDASVALEGARIVVGTVTNTKVADGTLTGAKLANGTIPSSKLHPDVIPIGTIISWWRPGTGHPVPSSWEIADGRTVSSANHDFTGAGIAGSSITTPDMRNKFILGADNPSATGGYVEGAAGTPGDGTSAVGAKHPNAPGIRGTGGANATRNLTHLHSVTIPGHFHSINITTSLTNIDHGHGIFPDGAHSHSLAFSSGPNVFPGIASVNFGSDIAGVVQPNFGVFIGTNVSGGHNHGGWTAGMSQNVSHNHSVSGNTNSGTGLNGANNQTVNTENALSAVDTRPAYVGLLYLIKVKN